MSTTDTNVMKHTRRRCSKGSCTQRFHDFDAFERHSKRCDGVNFVHSPKKRSSTPKKRRNRSSSRSPARG